MIGITHDEILSGSATIVKVEGPLNGQTSFDFEDYLNQLIEKKIVYILFDAKELDYVSSEGIGVLLLVQQKIFELNGYLVFFNLSEELVSFFTILGFDKIFKIADSRVQAIQTMDRQIELREMGDNLSGQQNVAYHMNADQLISLETVAKHDKEEHKIVEAYISDTYGAKSQLKIKQPEKTVPIKPETPTEDEVEKDNAVKIDNKTGKEEVIAGFPEKGVIAHENLQKQHILAKDDIETVIEKQPISEGAGAPLQYAIDSSHNSFLQPLIIECKKCKSLVRVKTPGEYLCPDCRTVFTTRKDQTVVFEIAD